MSTIPRESITGNSITPKLHFGTCRYCGCSGPRGCVLAVGAFLVTCWWIDREHTVCSNPACWERAKREGVLPKRGGSGEQATA